VTGRKRFTMDLAVPGALPTMVCRPPTINGKVGSVANLAAVRAMPGVTDVVVISTGVAVRAVPLWMTDEAATEAMVREALTVAGVGHA